MSPDTPTTHAEETDGVKSWAIEAMARIEPQCRKAWLEPRGLTGWEQMPTLTLADFEALHRVLGENERPEQGAKP